ncbi:App1 family protein [Massilia sp. DWR3-1-1]|uniref:App1 family protein n=1 Tax=Massilia sp. DWR3-1-1 TaxID=2804559 RepID=UPI003CEDF5DF
MPYLILTRAGLDSLSGPRGVPAGTSLQLNPGLASAAEIDALHAAGLRVAVLATAVTPEQAAALARQLPSLPGESWWIEAAPAAPRAHAPAPVAVPAPAAQPVAVPAPPAQPRRRVVSTVGRLARAARRAAAYGIARRQLMLLPYLGYGSAGGLAVRGRVLDERAFGPQQAGDSGWRNLAALYRRLEADQVAGEAVSARYDGQTWLTRTDRGGYFSFDIRPASAPAPGWLTVELALPDAPSAVHASASVLVPGAGARFGVISDIDDTVLWTNVTNKLNMALMLARLNPHTRRPFKGVAAFYRALRDGAGAPADGGANPLFYVSSSPWHLFAHLREFLHLHGLPPGPLLLRELGWQQLFKMGEHGKHKLARIEHILATYPQLPFVLIGDSGEQDPEIYAELVRRHPRRVSVIYIRNVNPDPARIAALERLGEQVAAAGSELVVVADSEAAAVHAVGAGLIDGARLAEVRADLRLATP